MAGLRAPSLRLEIQEFVGEEVQQLLVLRTRTASERSGPQSGLRFVSEFCAFVDIYALYVARVLIV